MHQPYIRPNIAHCVLAPEIPHDRKLIAELRPHIYAAIKASPITCATLRYDAILKLILSYGLDPNNRIEEFDKLSRAATHTYSRALSKCRQDLDMRNLIDRKMMATEDPGIPISRTHEITNALYQQCGIANVIRGCEEVAVAYSASLRYAWPKTTILTRLIDDEGELEFMLDTGVFESNAHRFVSASMTVSRGLRYRPILYKIMLTPKYRRRISVLTHTSVFECEHPEVLHGYKPYDVLEDEVRMENGTQIEPNTLEIIFRYVKLPSPTTMRALQEKYAPLGPVTFELHNAS